jgi:glyoxylase-like metal-dependent hydrolase (beta-lactamase superfamily II)
MLIDRVVAPYFETNCWILAAGESEECIIVDPGMAKPNLVDQIVSKVREHNTSYSWTFRSYFFSTSTY